MPNCILITEMSKIYNMEKKEYLIKGPIKSSIVAEYIDLQGKDKSLGAHSIFLGQVRSDVFGEKIVDKIEYSAYEEMVNKTIHNIEYVIFKKYPDVKKMYILHSTGKVRAGENSLFVMISGCHRIEALSACSETVDLIKETIPVWKKEIFKDKSYVWGKNVLK